MFLDALGPGWRLPLQGPQGVEVPHFGSILLQLRHQDKRGRPSERRLERAVRSPKPDSCRGVRELAMANSLVRLVLEIAFDVGSNYVKKELQASRAARAWEGARSAKDASLKTAYDKVSAQITETTRLFNAARLQAA